MRIIFAEANLSDNVSSWLFSFLVQVIGMGVIPYVLWKWWVKGDFFVDFSIKPKINPLIYLVAVLLGFLTVYLTMGVSYIWQVVISLLGYTHINGAGTIYSGPEVFIMELITTAMLPAIFEELNYRGLSMQMYKDIGDDKLKMIFMAVMFGLCHQNVVQTGYTIVGGFILSYLALKTHSIIPSMIIHFINNGLSVLSSYQSQHGGGYAKLIDGVYDFIMRNLLLALVTWVAAAFAVVYLCKFASKLAKDGKEEKPPKENAPFSELNGPSTGDIFDRIFNSDLKEEIAAKQVPKWYEYAFLYSAVALTGLVTLFTFVWGLQR